MAKVDLRKTPKTIQEWLDHSIEHYSRVLVDIPNIDWSDSQKVGRLLVEDFIDTLEHYKRFLVK